ncbi:alpha/beta fold hydrolase [Rhodococcus erythropolis]|jgi:2-hydroxy-6-oxonona-2,4-dienedioate hydrolase|uniref:alpha/beta fold hydrolase n=1 Tax=Rhodococcus erythropolis TaxID=1833 RepID=UPI00087831EB|nr:alpha/beta hydrolase [Rhodococcus erythropolis]MDF2467792.1 alpha/beta hydrolase [Rhodococcus erythropolis]OFV75768.1 2-hydroxy-6-oxo-6-phenylhexa-2,4-dienoate hydrolase [Rhodococcus erythropolis]
MTIWNELAGLDFELTTVDAGGVPTRSLQAGSGDEAVIFLHGTSGHLEAFARNIAPHAESYRVHAIDMLGHGYTGKPDYPYEIPRYVEHLVNYLDAVGLDRVHLVGESLGGWVAAYLASEQPERVLSLQLLAAGGTVANPVVMERIKTSTAKAVQSDDIELTRARMQLLMHDPADATEELVQARQRIYHQPDFVANIHNLLSLQEMEVRQRNLLRPDRMALIKAPTLVVWGQENPFGDVPEAKKMAEDIPGAQLELYSECGHWPQHEQAAKYNPLSLEFLAKASASAKAAI